MLLEVALPSLGGGGHPGWRWEAFFWSQGCDQKPTGDSLPAPPPPTALPRFQYAPGDHKVDTAAAQTFHPKKAPNAILPMKAARNTPSRW